MQAYARLLHRRDELIKVIELLLIFLKNKARKEGSIYEPMQYLVDCRAQLAVIKSQINVLLFGEP